MRLTAAARISGLRAEGHDQFSRYRRCKAIAPVNGRCSNDGIRVWPKRGGGYRHDPEEVRLAAKRHDWLERKDML